MKLDLFEGVELDYLARDLMAGSHLEHPPLEPAQTAVLVIDMQYLDASRDHGLGLRAQEAGVADRFEHRFARIDEIVPRIRRLIDDCRDLGVTIVHIRVANQPGVELRDGAISLCTEGDEDAEFLPELEPQEGDLVLSKQSVSAWTSTSIDALLRERGIRAVVGCGIVTSGCVELTMRDAADHGFLGVVVGDCCGANTPDAHRAALERMSRGPLRVLDSEAVAAELHGVARAAEGVAG
jgi:nicotinamidase-related amidase